MLYTCDEGELVLTGSKTSLETVQGAHLSNLTDTDVQAIMVTGQKTLEQLPKLDNVFPDLVSILWTFGNLKSISAEDLKPFPRLVVLILNDNQITSLEADLFVHTRKLILVELRDNKIKHIGPDVFTGLDKLTKVDLLRNKCIDIEAVQDDELTRLRDDLKTSCKPNTARANYEIEQDEDSEEKSGGECTNERCRSKTEL